MKEELAKFTTEALDQWMTDRLYDKSYFAILDNFIYEGHGIEKGDKEYYWYFIERGKKRYLKTFSTEEGVVKYAYKQIKNCLSSSSKCVLSTNDKEWFNKVVSDLNKNNIEYRSFSNKLPDKYCIYISYLDLSKKPDSLRLVNKK